MAEKSHGEYSDATAFIFNETAPALPLAHRRGCLYFQG